MESSPIPYSLPVYVSDKLFFFPSSAAAFIFQD